MIDERDAVLELALAMVRGQSERARTGVAVDGRGRRALSPVERLRSLGSAVGWLVFAARIVAGARVVDSERARVLIGPERSEGPPLAPRRHTQRPANAAGPDAGRDTPCKTPLSELGRRPLEADDSAIDEQEGGG